MRKESHSDGWAKGKEQHEVTLVDIGLGLVAFGGFLLVEGTRAGVDILGAAASGTIAAVSTSNAATPSASDVVDLSSFEDCEEGAGKGAQAGRGCTSRTDLHF